MKVNAAFTHTQGLKKRLACFTVDVHVPLHGREGVCCELILVCTRETFTLVFVFKYVCGVENIYEMCVLGKYVCLITNVTHSTCTHACMQPFTATETALATFNAQHSATQLERRWLWGTFAAAAMRRSRCRGSGTSAQRWVVIDHSALGVLHGFETSKDGILFHGVTDVLL